MSAPPRSSSSAWRSTASRSCATRSRSRSPTSSPTSTICSRSRTRAGCSGPTRSFRSPRGTRDSSRCRRASPARAGRRGSRPGLLIIGAARAVFMLAVYLAFERLSGSARLAGLGALLCTAAPTFLFFAGQFSYESLAVPLAAVALFALVRRQGVRRPGRATALERADRRRRARDRPDAPHHRVRAIVAFLIAVSVTQSVIDRPRAAPWIVTAIVAVLALAWLGLVASSTIEYLRPVLSDALDKVVDTLQRESETRTLFRLHRQRGVHAGRRAARRPRRGGAGRRRRAHRPARAPPRVAARSGPARLRPRRRRLPRHAALQARPGGAGDGRAAPGPSCSSASASPPPPGCSGGLDRNGPPGRGRRVAASAAVLLVICGGVIAGWPASLRLAQPFRVAVDGRTLEPPQVAAAGWSRRLGTEQAVRRPGRRRAAARLVDGQQTAFQGVNPAIADLLDAEALEPWQRTLLRDNRIGLLMDRPPDAQRRQHRGVLLRPRAPRARSGRDRREVRPARGRSPVRRRERSGGLRRGRPVVRGLRTDLVLVAAAAVLAAVVVLLVPGDVVVLRAPAAILLLLVPARLRADRGVPAAGAPATGGAHAAGRRSTKASSSRCSPRWRCTPPASTSTAGAWAIALGLLSCALALAGQARGGARALHVRSPGLPAPPRSPRSPPRSSSRAARRRWGSPRCARRTTPPGRPRCGAARARWPGGGPGRRAQRAAARRGVHRGR